MSGIDEKVDMKLKDIKTFKIIFHIIIGKLKIKDIKISYNVYRVLYDIDNDGFKLKELKYISYKNLIKAIEFRNNYTNMRKIDKFYIFEFLLETLESLEDNRYVEDILNRFDVPANLLFKFNKLRNK